MNWEAISVIAESIGVIAVLITLIYLAIQVRQNTEMSRQWDLRFYLSRPRGGQWWQSQGREMLSDQFVSFVDGLIES